MKVKSIVLRILAVAVILTMLTMLVFALEALQIESIVLVNLSNQLECPLHPELVLLLVKGSKKDAGDVECKIPSPGGTITYYIPEASVNAAEIILTKADQSVSGTADNGKTDAQNVLSEIADANNLAPNYTDAASILQPAVPYINIGLGLVTTIVVLLMSILTALDLCYIAIPAMRNFMNDKAAEGNAVVLKKDGNGGVKLRFISDEAQFAVEQSANNQGSSPWGTYFKSRILSYIFLAVAMVILLTGNITIITDLAVKLVSGLMSVLQGLT